MIIWSQADYELVFWGRKFYISNSPVAPLSNELPSSWEIVAL